MRVSDWHRPEAMLFIKAIAGFNRVFDNSISRSAPAAVANWIALTINKSPYPRPRASD